MRIAENVRPDDWVMLKVDVEGAEYNLIPCLAQFSTVQHWYLVMRKQPVGEPSPKTNCQGEAGMVDRMYLEEQLVGFHPSQLLRCKIATSRGTLHRAANLCKEAAKSALAEAKKQLVGKHVDIPNYYSET